MARPNIDEVRQMSDFQSVFRWNVRFENLPTAVKGFSSDALNLRCETSSIPKATTQQGEVMLRGLKVKQPSIMEYDGTMTLTFVETVDNTIKSFLKTWREAIWATRTGVASGDKRSLQGVIVLSLLNSQDVEIWTVKLYGAILSDYDLGQLDGSGTDFMKPSMTLAYDYFDDAAV